ncbi:MAG: thioredoxin, partial [Bacteroidales bacterium]|nr:thioredoxin [Bacteroidales bacterium]
MKKLFLIITMLASFGFASAQEKYYDESINGMEQIHNAIAEAAETGRYVLCQVGGNWCPWCIRFAQFATTDTAIAPLIKE